MAASNTRKNVKVRTAEDLGRALGLSMANTAEIEFRSELTVVLANGNTHGVSTDVLIRVLAATGYRAEVRVKKAAA